MFFKNIDLFSPMRFFPFSWLMWVGFSTKLIPNTFLCQDELIKIRRIIIERQLKQNYIKLSIPLQQWLFFFMNGCTSFNAAFCKIVCDGNGFILHLSFRSWQFLRNFPTITLQRHPSTRFIKAENVGVRLEKLQRTFQNHIQWETSKLKAVFSSILITQLVVWSSTLNDWLCKGKWIFYYLDYENIVWCYSSLKRTQFKKVTKYSRPLNRNFWSWIHFKPGGSKMSDCPDGCCLNCNLPYFDYCYCFCYYSCMLRIIREH